MRTVVHGDDFVSEVSEGGLREFKDEFEKEFDIKTEVLGPKAGMVQQLKILNRIVSWEKDGINVGTRSQAR